MLAVTLIIRFFEECHKMKSNFLKKKRPYSVCKFYLRLYAIARYILFLIIQFFIFLLNPRYNNLDLCTIQYDVGHPVFHGQLSIRFLEFNCYFI